MAVNIDLQKLLDTGAHFGHQSRRWNPKMEKYIHSEENGVHVFDLIKTKEMLEEALDRVREASKKGEKIVLVGTKKQAKDLVRDAAKKMGAFFVTERWLGGTLTNFGQIEKSLARLREMKEKRQNGEYEKYTKKERVLIDREIDRLERFFGGLSGLEGLPELMIIFDIKKEKGAALEARKKDVETIGIVDTNADPELVDIAVPMNDDATKAISYVLDLFSKAVEEGKKKAKTKKKSTNKSKNKKTKKKSADK